MLGLNEASGASVFLGSGMRINLQQWAQLDSGAVSPESSVPGCHACQVMKAHSGIALHGNGGLFGASHPWCIGESCLDGGFGHHALGAILP